MVVKRFVLLAVVAAFAASIATPAGAARRLVPAPRRTPALRESASQSQNWSGYSKALFSQTLPDGAFHHIRGEWNVPTVSRRSGRGGATSVWVGIGGGCLYDGCLASDTTLIQAGTEQDVDDLGNTSYYAWIELVPVPQLIISDFAVRPGDHMRIDIDEVVDFSEVWTITVYNLTTGDEYDSPPLPYTSSYASAEWILETPLTFGAGSSVGIAAMPNLTTTSFYGDFLNGLSVRWTEAERTILVSGGAVEATPSSPTVNRFNVCTWSATCTAPK